VVKALYETLHALRDVKILVLGDLVLDVYTKGVVQRISPEAPVPVLLVSSTTESPGGAGNVALNLSSLGATVTLVGRIGNDEAGKKISYLLEDRFFDTKGLFVQKKWITPRKNRLIADSQQIVRCDYEKILPLDLELEEEIVSYLEKSIGEHDLIALSDYGKGFLTPSLLQKIFSIAKEHNIRVLVDPKGHDFTKYSGAFLIKPNNKEAYAAARCEGDTPLEVVAARLFQESSMEFLLITRAEKGMTLFAKDLSRQDFPVSKRDVLDVTGAGDTALAMMALGIASNLPLETTINLANIASGLAIEKLGCAEISFSDVLHGLVKDNPLGKIFTSLHLAKILQDESIILLLVTDEEISSYLFHGIKEASERKGKNKLVIHVTPTDSNEDFIHLLASMYGVDFVLATSPLSEEALKNFQIEEMVETSSFSMVEWKNKYC
jgi:rfaE bifunctional protein kinase chain/domain